MPRVINLQKVQITVLLEVSCCRAIDYPVDIFGCVELVFELPFGGVGPCLPSPPITNPILIPRINQHLHISSIKERGNLRHQVSHPVSKEESMDHSIALDPPAPFHAQHFFDNFRVQELVRLAEIVAQWRLFTRDANVVDVKSRGEGIAEDGVGEELAELSCRHLQTKVGIGA